MNLDLYLDMSKDLTICFPEDGINDFTNACCGIYISKLSDLMIRIVMESNDALFEEGSNGGSLHI